MKRCIWCGDDPLYTAYHDEEWGVPLHDDRKLFEFLVLDGAQAGLSWLTILRKRENYRRAFDGFDPRKVAAYSEKRVQKLLNNPGIIRNRLKIRSAVKNAQAVLRIQDRYGSLNSFLWRYVGGQPIQNKWRSDSQIPAETAESRNMSRDLKKMGCSFVGPTICYAFMQAAGMVNDHVVGCFRHDAVLKMGRARKQA